MVALLFFFAIVFLLHSCGGFYGKIHREPSEAEKLLLSLKNKNFALNTFKSTGKISFWEKGNKGMSAGIAMAGAKSDKIRIAVRDVSGQPVTSLASDGKWLYVFLHTKRKFYKKPSTSSTLKKLISMPIKPSDMVSILTGCATIRKYRSVFLTKNNNGYVLILKARWGNVIEKIYLNEDKKYIRKIEIFNANETLAYSVIFNKMQNIQEYQIPLQLIFSNNNGDGFQIDIDRYWTNAAVSPSMFVLKPPKLSIEKKGR